MSKSLWLCPVPSALAGPALSRAVSSPACVSHPPASTRLYHTPPSQPAPGQAQDTLELGALGAWAPGAMGPGRGLAGPERGHPALHAIVLLSPPQATGLSNSPRCEGRLVA